jgi:hypothetical protein
MTTIQIVSCVVVLVLAGFFALMTKALGGW